METTSKLMVPLLVTLLAGIIFVIVDMLAASQSPSMQATVVERIYTSQSSSAGIGTGVTSSGQVGIMVITSSEPEKWTVIVDVSGKVVSAKANATQWSSAVAGQEASVAYRRGWITGWNYGWVYLGECANKGWNTRERNTMQSSSDKVRWEYPLCKPNDQADTRRQ